ncbi:hypothetical protein [Mycobacterium gastri]|uniref:hypothetical protein n=1 Tax=Mycobacterium gastri TaxID=1777 RepID=UPI0004B7D1A0|nr:hypothetical protein [Mycobacterium gastri]
MRPAATPPSCSACGGAFWESAPGYLSRASANSPKPGRTARGILAIEDAGAEQVVHELG